MPNPPWRCALSLSILAFITVTGKLKLEAATRLRQVGRPTRSQRPTTVRVSTRILNRRTSAHRQCQGRAMDLANLTSSGRPKRSRRRSRHVAAPCAVLQLERESSVPYSVRGEPLCVTHDRCVSSVHVSSTCISALVVPPPCIHVTERESLSGDCGIDLRTCREGSFLRRTREALSGFSGLQPGATAARQ